MNAYRRLFARGRTKNKCMDAGEAGHLPSFYGEGEKMPMAAEEKFSNYKAVEAFLWKWKLRKRLRKQKGSQRTQGCGASNQRSIKLDFSPTIEKQLCNHRCLSPLPLYWSHSLQINHSLRLNFN